jgi:hypothetical protein
MIGLGVISFSLTIGTVRLIKLALILIPLI